MIAVENLSVKAGAFRPDAVTFAVGEGEFIARMGETGSGKTTIIDAVRGLRPDHAGPVLRLGRDATRPNQPPRPTRHDESPRTTTGRFSPPFDSSQAGLHPAVAPRNLMLEPPRQGGAYIFWMREDSWHVVL